MGYFNFSLILSFYEARSSSAYKYILASYIYRHKAKQKTSKKNLAQKPQLTVTIGEEALFKRLFTIKKYLNYFSIRHSNTYTR